MHNLHFSEKGILWLLENLNIDFNDEDEDDNQDVYEGYYRLFTDEGVPFGDILYLQVVVDD